ncbi:organic hydroperoxide resistance protein [Brevibacillus reuszeri]|uniref:organic hydroperoxide resistance protein n=1 Tax=Brevibacillus reuszeri TaxID=54915 RepID=UPI00289920DF|nr:organic hydroperoxide resistance protein [Brevibacillus reuszeri]
MNKIQTKLYTASVTVSGERNGKAVSSDGVLHLDLRVPKGLGGAGEHGTNPEQLFGAGYAACFEGALGVALRQRRLKAEGTRVTAHITIGKDEHGSFTLAAKLDVTVPGFEEDFVRELIEQAHQICPYSRATRGNIEVEFNVVI